MTEVDQPENEAFSALITRTIDLFRTNAPVILAEGGLYDLLNAAFDTLRDFSEDPLDGLRILLPRLVDINPSTTQLAELNERYEPYKAETIRDYFFNVGAILLSHEVRRLKPDIADEEAQLVERHIY